MFGEVKDEPKTETVKKHPPKKQNEKIIIIHTKNNYNDGYQHDQTIKYLRKTFETERNRRYRKIKMLAIKNNNNKKRRMINILFHSVVFNDDDEQYQKQK